MATGGVTPHLSPLFVLFLVLSVCGAVLLLVALVRRNLVLVFRDKLNPFSVTDAMRAAAMLTGTTPFTRTRYGRVALTLLVTGLVGLTGVWLWELFA